MVRRGWLGVCGVFPRAWSLRGMWVPGEHMHVLGASARVEPQAAGHIYDHQGGVYMWHGHLIRPASSAASFHPPQLRRAYTPTPNGFESFLRACVGLAPAVGAMTLDLSMMHGAGPMPQIVVFDNEDFIGDHTHLFGNMKDLGKWGNSISSLIILSGTWEFFDDEDFKGTSLGTLGPGMYANVTDKGLKNNSISSVRLASPGGGSMR
jgi:Beta/Gamma crystallin